MAKYDNWRERGFLSANSMSDLNNNFDTVNLSDEELNKLIAEIELKTDNDIEEHMEELPPDEVLKKLEEIAMQNSMDFHFVDTSLDKFEKIVDKAENEVLIEKSQSNIDDTTIVATQPIDTDTVDVVVAPETDDTPAEDVPQIEALPQIDMIPQENEVSEVVENIDAPTNIEISVEETEPQPEPLKPENPLDISSNVASTSFYRDTAINSGFDFRNPQARPVDIASKVDIAPEFKAEPQTEIEPQTEVEPQTEIEPQTEVEPQTELEPQTEVEPQTELEPQTEVEPQTDSDMKIVEDTKIETETVKVVPTEDDVTVFEPTKSAAVKKDAQSTKYTVLGVVVFLFAVIGIGALIYTGVTFAINYFNTPANEDEFDHIIYPLTIIDTPEFESVENLTANTIISAGVWNFIISDSDKSRYSVTENNELIVPAADMEPYIKQIFGPDVAIEHKSVKTDGFEVIYDAESSLYVVPQTSHASQYTPVVNQIFMEGDTYTVQVNYVLQGPFWDNEQLDGQEVKKVVDFVLQTQENGTYIISSVKIVKDDMTTPSENVSDDEDTTSSEDESVTDDESGTDESTPEGDEVDDTAEPDGKLPANENTKIIFALHG